MGNAGPEGVATRADLARELSGLRARSGLTVRELAKRLGAPTATIGDYFAGRHLPGPAQISLFRALLVECGIASPAELEGWVEALGRVRLSSDGRSPKSDSPYQGLEPYGEANAELFFGRAAATTELLELLRRLAADGGPSAGLAVVVGPSGSGKSSMLAAGVVPAVHAGALDGNGESWDCICTTAAQLSSLQCDSAASRRELLVVDQLEEALAADLHSAERRSLLRVLADAQSERRVIVAALRADFYQAALAEPILLSALRHAQMPLGPMTERQLRQAIVEPARRAGARVEDGLVDLVLSELAPGAPEGCAYDVGALPLVSHVMWVIWGRARRGALTVADYRAVGGLAGAIGQSAEELYSGLTPAEQALTRRIFTRLVRIEPEGPTTRRRLRREELEGLADTPGITRGLLEAFIAARLLSADESSVQISHEALIRAWPRLGEWLGADRVALRVHQQLRDAANAWAGAGRDESLLWRGTRLGAASGWAEEPDHRAFLNVVESEFLADSLANYRAAQLATRRRARQMRQLVVTLAVLVLVAGGLAGYALQSRAVAAAARDQALSRQVAIEASQLAPTEPSLAAQLALAAYRASPTLQARSALIDATAGEIPTRLLGPTGPTFVSVSGQLMAVAESGADAVQLYSLAGAGPVKRGHLDVGPAADQDYAVALSPDGTLLAAGGTNGSITLWDVASPAHPAKLAVIRNVTGTVYSVAFSADSDELAAADSDGSLGQWNVSDPRHPVALTTLHAPTGASLKAVAYSPDGARLAAAGSGGTLLVWRTGQSIPDVVSGSGTSALESVAFSPDGSTLATGGDDGSVRVYDLDADTAKPTHVLLGATSLVYSVAFSTDGSALAAGSADGSLRLYDTRTWSPSATFGGPSDVTSVAFTNNSQSVVSADSDGEVELWPLPPPSTRQTGGNVYSIQYSSDGKSLADVTGGTDGNIELWDDAQPLRPTLVASIAPPAGFGPVAGSGAVSPDGQLAAVANAQAEIALIDIADPAHPRYLGAPLRGNKPLVEEIAFSPNGRLLAASDDSGQVRLWDMNNPSQPLPLPTLEGKAEILGFSFSPNGDLVATASSDSKVRLYDIANPEAPRLLATLGGFSSYAYTTAFTPNGRTLIAGSADDTIRLWNLSKPDRPRALGPPLRGPTGYVFQIAVSPDGRTLAAATTSAQVWLWDIAQPSNPRVLDTLSAAQDAVFAVRFDPSEPVLAASGSDQTLHLWSYQPATAAKEICASVGDGITRAEWAEYVQGAPYRPPCAK